MISSNQQTVGQTLAQAREQKGLTIDEVVSILKVRKQIIDMIENDLYETQGIDVYIKGHIITYCKLLDMNHKTVLNNLEAKGYDLYQPQNIPASLPNGEKNRKKVLAAIFGSLIILSIYDFSTRTHTNKPYQEIKKPLTYQVKEAPYV